ncbi:MAG: chromosome segregation protein SMC [Clostridia bacterium]|nr:chromosome segregation protein SMC [Clostridia bacterium]
MNFEKVEIFGFKSFADKAEIKFGNGITGIVGPNGCGKSNVAEAIRWVLGEQSAKSLRGSSMQDVIFSGTQNRKSLSYCEVSLFFNNSTRMFSLDYDEIILTRKLFRSGESEYFINKQPARLRDIVELLHECGIGKEGYSIISQGKVGEIMSAKPEERRMIFEEATGISKFKTRKNESERKLERTRENILRYSDILTEIENQLGPLEKQAEKAKEFNELSAMLKHHELNTYVAKVEGVGAEKEKINVRIKGLEEQTLLRQQEMAKAQMEYDKIFEEITKSDERLKNLNDELTSKLVLIERSSGTKQLFEERINYLNSQIDRSEKEIAENVKLVKDCKSTIKATLEDLETLSTLQKDLEKEYENLITELTKVNEKISLTEELTNKNREKVIESIESLTDAKVNKGTMSIEKKSLLEKLEEVSNKLNDLLVKRDNLFNEKERCDSNINQLDRSVYELKNAISNKENEVREGNEAVAKIDNKIYTLNSTLATLITKDNFYKSIKENYEGYTQAVKLLLTKGKSNPQINSKIKGVVAEIIKSDKMFDVALETALGNAAQNVVTATTEDAKYLIEYLKVNKFGRVTFLPITSVKPREVHPTMLLALKDKGALGIASKLVKYDAQYENIISNLLGNTLIVDTLENATYIANKYHFAFKMVTLDGDVFSTQGAMTGGSRRNEGEGLLSGDRKIEDNQRLLEEKSKEMDKLKEEKILLEKSRDKALDELSLLNERYNEARRQVVLEGEKQAVAEKGLIDIGKEIENADEIIEVINNKIAKIDEDYKAVISGSKQLEENKLSAKEIADKNTLEYENLRKNRDLLTEKITSLKVKITETKGEIASKTEERDRLLVVIKEAEQTNERLTSSNDDAKGMIEQIKLDREKVALTQEEQNYVNSLREKIDGIENAKLSLKEKLNKNDEVKKQISTEISNLAEKKFNEENNLTKIDTTLEFMGQSIFEDYQETYDSAVKYKEEGYDAKFGEQEIARIRRRRSSLGPINAAAIEDSKAFKERYDEMTAQKEDLLKAEADLKQAIDTIKGEMLTQFDEGFKKINENFQQIFKELFGGGRAMLELDYTEVDDKLEAGVEIIAEPPGKKLQKLSLLSGGEKALTAIAILFAILRLRPMPFCVLDEIEAALDEANVDRFAKYLQKFSKETQFIVITHRKPTMEMADALFGVTMQEKGVSKMVSVKLADVMEMDIDKAM